MKTKLLLTALFVTLLTSATAQAFLAPTNAPPSVMLAWSPSPSPNVTNYFLYYGVGSLQYTNKIPTGTATNATVVLPARGVTYFFNVTAQAGGLESVFDGEVSYTPQAPPAPPTMKPIVILTVQTAPKADGLFADTGMNWSLLPDQPEAVYRLRLSKGFAVNQQTPPFPWAK